MISRPKADHTPFPIIWDDMNQVRKMHIIGYKPNGQWRCDLPQSVIYKGYLHLYADPVALLLSGKPSCLCSKYPITSVCLIINGQRCGWSVLPPTSDHRVSCLVITMP